MGQVAAPANVARRGDEGRPVNARSVPKAVYGRRHRVKSACEPKPTKGPPKDYLRSQSRYSRSLEPHSEDLTAQVFLRRGLIPAPWKASPRKTPPTLAGCPSAPGGQTW